MDHWMLNEMIHLLVVTTFCLCECGVLAQPPPPAQTVTVSVNGSAVLATTGAGLFSGNFDWHLNNEEPPAWDNCSINIMKINDTKTIYLASQLSPGHLRIGGSEGDVMIYDIGEHLPCKPGFCLSMDRWQQIVAFSQETDLKLVFGLNCMYGRANKSAQWDKRNSDAFLQYTAQHKLPVYGFEVCNEKQGQVHADVMADSYQDVHEMLVKYWPDVATRPKLIGPDENPNAGFLEEFLPLVADVIDAVTVHIYTGYGLDHNLPAQITTGQYLDKYQSTLAPLAKVINDKAPKAEIWIGETAAAWHSGQMNTTNTFLSGFWYLDALGTAANNNVQAFCRQTLIGGYYELLNRTTRDPNPDFYTGLLWNKLMGTKMLHVTSTVSRSSLRLYAACSAASFQAKTPGSVTVAFINIADTAFSASPASLVHRIDGKENLGTIEYHLIPGDGQMTLRTTQMMLNDKLLELDENNKLPAMDGLVRSGPVLIAPKSYGFVVVPDANADVCT
ncbi:uncharacterized protein LOC135808944 [Sycon ciliatum]|uniref:uncharacterized protein LOC135808944 n=1 Tax=Sycon ciliatum TaxID=27933 RepID=UPI0031F6EF1E